jgi:hypothetical protein
VRRLEGLLEEPRPGAPRSIADAQVEEVVTRTLESMPENSTHWSSRLMSGKTGLSQTAIVRIWHAFGLQAASGGKFQILQRSAVRRKGAGYRGVVYEPAGSCHNALRGRKSRVQVRVGERPSRPPAQISSGKRACENLLRESTPVCRPFGDYAFRLTTTDDRDPSTSE